MEFRLSRGWRILYYILVVPIVGSIACAMVFFIIKKPDSWWVWATVMPICLGAIGFFIYGLFEAIYGKYILDATGISYIGKFEERRLLHDEVLGYRIDEQYLNIIPRNRERKKIKISSYTERYSEIVNFISSLHSDLHQMNAQQEEEEILSKAEYGDTAEEREIRLKSARLTARAVNVAGSVIGAWVLFKPMPYEIAVIAAIVMVVVPLPILFAYKGLIRINEEKGTAYPSIIYGIVFPALGVYLRGLIDFEIEYYGSLGWYIAIAGLMLSVLYILGTKEFTFKKWVDYLAVLVIAAVLSAYCYGAAVFGNCYYDQSAPLSYRATVTDKHISSGNSRSYYLKLSPWGPRTEPEDVSVSKDEYELFEVGEELNVSLHEGRLGATWIYVSKKL